MSDEESEPLTGGEKPSVYVHFVYRPDRVAPRKGAHEKTVGHEWVCRNCHKVAHREPLVGMDNETFDEATARHKRLYAATTAHWEGHVREMAEEEAKREAEEESDG